MIGENQGVVDHAELGTTEHALVAKVVRHLDRVAFIPRDLVLAHATGRVAADVFDRYRPTAQEVGAPVLDSVWRAVIDELCRRAMH